MSAADGAELQAPRKPSRARKARGMATQAAVARWMATHGWPFAESTGAGRSGSDVLGTPGIALEVKARADLSPMAWLRQARAGSKPGDVAAVVFRPNGVGEASVAGWPVLLDLATFTDLLRAAGYGTPPESDQAARPREDDDR